MTSIDPSEHTISELEEALEDVDDPDELEAILDAEQEGENRAGAKEAIEERLADVEDESDAVDEDERDDEMSDDTDETTDDAEPTDEDEGDAGDGASGSLGILEIRREVETVAAEVIGRRLDGVTEVRKDGDEGWRAVVDVIERKSIPDTQDILGAYEVFLDESGNVVGYDRIRRYRRGNTDDYE